MAENSNYFGEMVIFHNEDGEVGVQIDAVNETMWATQKGISELFDVSIPTISYHLKEIYGSGELLEDSTIRKIKIVQQEGNRNVEREVSLYNLDAIIAVGYRVNSKRATSFRKWATKVLRDYMVKGYLLDENRFVKGQSLTYFKELVSKIRQIRISERVFYQQVKDIYKLSIDYDDDDERTREFFATVQNKLLWAVSGKTAAELIYYRSNPSLPQMGLTSTEEKGKVRANDVAVGKNYLNEDEIENLKYIVDQYLSFAEAQAFNHIPMRMVDWEQNLNIILTMNRKDILTTKGKVKMELAKKTAHARYLEYKEKEKLEERIASLKELDEDMKKVKKRIK